MIQERSCQPEVGHRLGQRGRALLQADDDVPHEWQAIGEGGRVWRRLDSLAKALATLRNSSAFATRKVVSASGQALGQIAQVGGADGRQAADGGHAHVVGAQRKA